jgi:hypothetical protein
MYYHKSSKGRNHLEDTWRMPLSKWFPRVFEVRMVLGRVKDRGKKNPSAGSAGIPKKQI